MKVLTITIESSITKNLGNYQSTKQAVTVTVELNRELNSTTRDYVFADVFDILNPEIESQLRSQLIHAQRSMVDLERGEE